MRRRGKHLLDRAEDRPGRSARIHAEPGDDNVRAWILRQDGAELDPKELHSWPAESLPYLAVPRNVKFTDRVPAKASGRVQKFKLRELGNADAWGFDSLGLIIGKADRRGRDSTRRR